MGCDVSKSRDMKQRAVEVGAGRANCRPVGVHVSREEYYRTHRAVGDYRALGTALPPPTPTNTRSAGAGAGGGGGAAGARLSADEKRVLKIVHVDLLATYNSSLHHTDGYQTNTPTTNSTPSTPSTHSNRRLVLRRGERFDIDVTFDRPYDDVRDDVRFIFDVGVSGRESQGTRSVVSVQSGDGDTAGQWTGKVVRQREETVTFQFYIPASLPVAQWHLSIDTVINKGEHKFKVFRYVHQQPVVIICNPWCPDDQVFLNDESSRQEFTLCDYGLIQLGTAQHITNRPWNFCQFEDCVLDVCLLLLDKSQLSWRLRADLVHIVRSLAALVSPADDVSGLLVGNWSGDYGEGTDPCWRTSSLAVFQEYCTKQEPVKFTQCWMTSAVFTTLCRAIGIPARCVTSFSTARDTDGCPIIDLHWNAMDGKPLCSYNSDSLWCYHVWNDVWMSRSDLPVTGFSGWQAVDCTPLLAADGMCSVGPCSAGAIKNGLVRLTFNGQFMYSQLNADIINWIQQPDGNWSHSCLRNSIGKVICTKQHHDNTIQNITNLYKFTPGTMQHTTAAARALPEYYTEKYLDLVDVTDMSVELFVSDIVSVGSPVDIKHRLQSTASSDRSVTLSTSVMAVQVTGVPLHCVQQQQTTATIPSLTCSETVCRVEYKDYASWLTADNLLRVYVMCTVHETQQYHCTLLDIQLSAPTISIKVPESVTAGDVFDLDAMFSNPLPVSLTSCTFQVDCTGLQSPITIQHEPVAPYSDCQLTTQLTATRLNQMSQFLIVSFSSKQLVNITAFATVAVHSAASPNTPQL